MKLTIGHNQSVDIHWTFQSNFELLCPSIGSLYAHRIPENTQIQIGYNG